MNGQPAGHAHEIDLQASLDFVNTLELEDGLPVDHLTDPTTALAWLTEHGLLHAGAARPAATAALERIRDVRGALRAVVDAIAEDRPADAEALATVNDALARRDSVELVPAPDGARVTHRHVGDPIDAALARLADPLVDVVASGDPERLRICANETCRWAFYDTSRTGRRRWCDMASCGNRAKAARHRARMREAAVSNGGES